MHDTRMFRDDEESQIFSIAGELVAAEKRLRDHSMIHPADLTVRVALSDLKDIHWQIDRLMLLCMTAVSRETLDA